MKRRKWSNHCNKNVEYIWVIECDCWCDTDDDNNNNDDDDDDVQRWV